MPVEPQPVRAPIDAARLRRDLADLAFFADVETSEVTGSTNADLAELARSGAPEGTVGTTDLQTAGRGRLARTWTSAPRAGIAVSVLLRPDRVSRERWSWLPLLAGLAVAATVRRTGVVGAGLKWPNDVLVSERKIAGVLVEVIGGTDAIVVGIGLNATNQADELPPGATSLTLEGGDELDRTTLLVDLLRELARTYRSWCGVLGAPTALRPAYLARCTTVGRAVRAELPGGAVLTGTAVDVDEAGRLVVRTRDEDVPLGAGDVVHLR